ncbi:MAG: hypothetical protein IPP01_13515, partial [Saprospiraceae bacterium]|nr:hypothetical protein [Saprospiraceae bacterium]
MKRNEIVLKEAKEMWNNLSHGIHAKRNKFQDQIGYGERQQKGIRGLTE